MGEVPLVSKAERSPWTRSTEALQSCFSRPGLHSMTTGRRESSRSTCRRPWERGHPCPAKKKAEKKAEKKIEEVISRPFVSHEGRAGCGLPGAPSCPRLPRPRRVRPVEKSCTGCAVAAGGRPSAQAQGGRVLVANQVSAWPFGSPLVRKGRTTKNRRPDRCDRRPVNASLPAISHY